MRKNEHKRVRLARVERGVYLLVQAFIQLTLSLVASAGPLGPDIGMTEFESVEKIPACYIFLIRFMFQLL